METSFFIIFTFLGFGGPFFFFHLVTAKSLCCITNQGHYANAYSAGDLLPYRSFSSIGNTRLTLDDTANYRRGSACVEDTMPRRRSRPDFEPIRDSSTPVADRSTTTPWVLKP